MDPQVDRALVAARARGIDVREQIGTTGYCERWAIGDALVMRIPRSEFPVGLGRGDGPILDGRGIDSAVLARTLLESTTDRQRAVERAPLARFVDRLELDGIAVTLHERAVGRSPTREDIPAIARALAELHEVLGYHGHLVPAHIFIDGETVTFTDPLPVYAKLLGGVGYALPIAAQALASRDEGLLLRDVVALLAIAAELCGTELDWNVRYIEFLELVNRGGLGRPWDARPALDELFLRTQTIDDAVLRDWIAAAARLAIDHYLLAPGTRPTSAPRHAMPGIARSLLAQFDMHAKLGSIAAWIARSPSLFDFVAIERAAASRSYERPEYEPAFATREQSFSVIVAAMSELQLAYGDPAPVELAPIAQPAELDAEAHPLRSLLVDVERLLAPTPQTIAEAGGLLARARASIAALQEPATRYMAARRLVNYVGRSR